MLVSVSFRTLSALVYDCDLFSLRDQDRDERPDFSQVVDELFEITDSLPSAKHTDVSSPLPPHTLAPSPHSIQNLDSKDALDSLLRK